MLKPRVKEQGPQGLREMRGQRPAWQTSKSPLALSSQKISSVLTGKVLST